MSNLIDTHKRVRQSIVAFSPKYPNLLGADLSGPAHMEWIIGTGFVVEDSVIATNRHVIEALYKLPKPEEDKGIPAVALHFSRTKGGLGISILKIVKAAIMKGGQTAYSTQVPDVGFVTVNCRGLNNFKLELINAPIDVGTEVATAGFPMGRDLLAPNGSLERFGPVMQHGVVSAEAPFQGTMPHLYILDVMIQGGASGSPVFRVSDGKAVGILYASAMQIIEMTIYPTSFSYMVPSHLVSKALETAIDGLRAAVPADAPTIDQIIDSMPEKPTQKFTRGTYKHENSD